MMVAHPISAAIGVVAAVFGFMAAALGYVTLGVALGFGAALALMRYRQRRGYKATHER